MVERGVFLAAEGAGGEGGHQEAGMSVRNDNTAFDSSMDYVRSYKDLQGKHVDKLLRRKRREAIGLR